MDLGMSPKGEIIQQLSFRHILCIQVWLRYDCIIIWFTSWKAYDSWYTSGSGGRSFPEKFPWFPTAGASSSRVPCRCFGHPCFQMPRSRRQSVKLKNTLEKSVDLFWLEWVISWMDIWKRGKTIGTRMFEKHVADSERYLQFIMLEILIGICKIHSGCRNIPGKVSGGGHVLCKAQAGVPEDWQKRRPLWWFQELKNGIFSAYFLGWMMCFLSLAPKKKGH